MKTARERFVPVFNETITRAEVVEDDGTLALIVVTEKREFEIPVAAAKSRGFRGDLIGHQLVIGYLPPA